MLHPERCLPIQSTVPSWKLPSNSSTVPTCYFLKAAFQIIHCENPLLPESCLSIHPLYNLLPPESCLLIQSIVPSWKLPSNSSTVPTCYFLKAAFWFIHCANLLHPESCLLIHPLCQPVTSWKLPSNSSTVPTVTSWKLPSNSSTVPTCYFLKAAFQFIHCANMLHPESCLPIQSAVPSWKLLSNSSTVPTCYFLKAVFQFIHCENLLLPESCLSIHPLCQHVTSWKLPSNSIHCAFLKAAV